LPDADEFGECFAKSESDWWMVLKKVNSRLLCLLLPPSSNQQSLSDIQSRTLGIIKTHFEAIFLN
uniref:Intu_longin_1 domain-containing protein n=2 Tax=Haemonchus TaxID=6288 RepID=A0A0N4VXR2_HAEPC